ncbi:MAG: hypothetical protein II410_05175, partial [Ruminococcus sp.]|nr:hypothetical protein [Ruminococcus sp.]
MRQHKIEHQSRKIQQCPRKAANCSDNYKTDDDRCDYQVRYHSPASLCCSCSSFSCSRCCRS